MVVIGSVSFCLCTVCAAFVDGTGEDAGSDVSHGAAATETLILLKLASGSVTYCIHHQVSTVRVSGRWVYTRFLVPAHQTMALFRSLSRILSNSIRRWKRRTPSPWSKQNLIVHWRGFIVRQGRIGRPKQASLRSLSRMSLPLVS